MEAPDIQFQSGIHDAPLYSLFQLLLNTLPTQDASDTLYVDTVIHALTIRFLRWHGFTEKRMVTDNPISTRSRLRRVRDLIEANLEQPLGLEMLAREAGYSRSHFARWFHSSTGKSAHSFITERRLNRARHMLAGDLPIVDIATACGFADQSHMTQLFRRHFGTSPAAVRRRLAPAAAAPR